MASASSTELLFSQRSTSSAVINITGIVSWAMRLNIAQNEDDGDG